MPPPASNSSSAAWLISGSVILLLSSLALRQAKPANLFFLLLMTAAVAGLGIFPRRVRSMSNDPGQLLHWAIKVRLWGIIDGAVIAIGWIAIGRAPRQYLWVAAAAATWLAAVNFFARATFRRPSLLPAEMLPVFYMLSDFVLLAALAFLGLDWLLVAALSSLSLEFALLLHSRPSPWVPVLGLALSTGLLRNALLPQALGLPSAWLVLIVALTAASTSWLTLRNRPKTGSFDVAQPRP